MDHIIISDYTLNNLKNFSIKIPKNKLVVITGVSGSGKSTLAFDIIYQEGRKLYFQAIGLLPSILGTSDVGKISSLSPVISVQQTIKRDKSIKSLVGTKSEIFYYLQLIYLSLGTRHCVFCGGSLDNKNICINCKYEDYPIDVRFLNFNSFSGMCLRCHGLGYIYEFDFKRVIPNPDITVKTLLGKYYSMKKGKGPKTFLAKNDVGDIAYSSLTEDLKNELLYGFFHTEYGQYIGLIPYLQGKSGGSHIESYFNLKTCGCCGGLKIGDEAKNIRIDGKNIGEINNCSIYEIKDFLINIKDRVTDLNNENINNVYHHLLQEIDNFISVNLGHLTPNRMMKTLSGGEYQRFMLMKHLKVETDSFIYIFDEPTVSLHETEKEHILQEIIMLQKQGNSIIVIEHERKFIEKADYIIDMGPYGGSDGGKVIYQGDYTGLLQCSQSITGQTLSNKDFINVEKRHLIKDIKDYKSINLYNVRTNNLKNINVSIPLCGIIGIAGVSGSGKSSLISDTLVPELREYFKSPNTQEEPEFEINNQRIDSVDGFDNLDGFSEINQFPIGRNSLSIPLTYIGIWDEVRKLFANLKEAVEAGMDKKHFSFHDEGACPACQGSGMSVRTLGVLGDVGSKCPYCHGKRYKDDVLAFYYKGKNIGDILEMQISHGIEFFTDNHKIKKALNLLNDTGLGYLQLGQSVTTLSGGEAQRIKLAKELIKNTKGRKLYLLDEPTIGLSEYDIRKLIQVIQKLCKADNYFIIIEHDLYTLSCCDYIIELGPGSAHKGGEIISCGTPEELKCMPQSIIGRYF